MQNKLLSVQTYVNLTYIKANTALKILNKQQLLSIKNVTEKKSEETLQFF